MHSCLKAQTPGKYTNNKGNTFCHVVLSDSFGLSFLIAGNYIIKNNLQINTILCYVDCVYSVYIRSFMCIDLSPDGLYIYSVYYV